MGFDTFSQRSSNFSKTPYDREAIMAPLEYQKRIAMAKQKSDPHEENKAEVSINEMLGAVRDIWFELDQGRGVIELECDIVA